MPLRKTIVMILAMSLSGSLLAQENTDVVSYINKYRELAIEEMQRTGVPSAIILAQGIHESQAGKSDLVRRSNNHFGIKCKSDWNGDRVYHDDDRRAECFRSYASAEDSYRDHSDFLRNNQRYAFLFRLDPTDYKDWAFGLKKAGYATNSHYPEILIQLIETYHLEDYTLMALGRLPRTNESLAAVAADKPESIRASPGLPVTYPEGEFTLNNTPVVFARAGTSLLSLADRFSVSLKRLIDFNELSNDNVLSRDQLIFLQRKRKLGAHPYHRVEAGENLYSISQAEGIRFGSLLQLNHLKASEEPAVGETLYLQDQAPAAPSLAGSASLSYRTESNSESGNNPWPSRDGGKGYSTHVVVQGENLEVIARKYGVSAGKIKEWNNLKGEALQQGQELKIYKD